MMKGFVRRIPQETLVRFFDIIYKAGTFDKKFAATLNEYASLYKHSYGEGDSAALQKQIAFEHLIHDFTYDEYINFQLFGKSKDVIADYVTVAELLSVFAHSQRNTLPRDKYERYKLFEKWFHRDITHITFESTSRTIEEESYEQFIKHHNIFIVKPVSGVKGHGIKLISDEDAPDLLSLSEQVQGPVLLEEVINQGEELGKFHPESVNTLRLATGMNKNGEYFPMFALFRVGRGNAVVDNVGSGGIICLVDLEKGVIISDGLNNHSFYEHHPDTNIKFEGAIIPDWAELLAIAEKAHKEMPNQSLLGWDFAWSKKGWDLVEVNPAPSFASWQTLAGTGIRPFLKEIGLL